MSIRTIDMFVRELDVITKVSKEASEKAKAFEERLKEEVNFDQFGVDLLKTMVTLINKGIIERDQVDLDTSCEDGRIFITYMVKPKDIAADSDSKEVA